MAGMVVSASRPAPADRELPPLALEFVEVDGMRVRLGHRVAAGQAARHGVVLPGRAEFIEKYGETLGELTAEGFAVAILDWRGQGGSDRYIDQRYRGHVVQVDDYLADLAAVLGRLEQLSLPRPYLILAHSMGGHIALRHLHDHPDSFAGAVLTAPMFGIQLRPTPEPVARAICGLAIALGAATRYAPGQRDFDLTRFVFATNKLTSCPERYAGFLRQLAATPELALGGVTLWLARRRPALVGGGAATGLPGGDPDPHPGVPGRY